MKARAFTMIELLVVMGIIAVVATLLISVLHGGRESSESVQCIGNLRILAAANIRYAAENGGRFCPAQEKNNRVRWHGERPDLKTEFDPRRGPLAPYLGREERVKRCPSFVDMIKGGASFENGSGGYGYNAVYVGGSPRNKWEGELVSNIPNPAVTIMFADSALSKPEGIQEYPYAEPWQWVGPSGKLSGKLSPSVHFRHRGLANVAWCDGHVSSEKYARLGNENVYGGNDAKHKLGWFGPAEGNGWWNPNYQPAR